MKRFLLIFAVVSYLYSTGSTPDYGPTDYNVITSTSQGFVVINDLSIWGESVVYGTNNNTAIGHCPSLNCDIIAVMYGGICVGWSYSTQINNQIFITVNFNDQITPNLDEYPYPGDSVTLNFFDTSDGIMYYGIGSTQVFPLSQSTISNINIEGDGEFISDNEGCPLSFDEYFDPFAGAGNCSLCNIEYSFCGCTDSEAYNYNEIATIENNSCDYSYYLEHSLTNGNNLISFPGNFENSNTLNILSELLDNNVNINFIMGQGLGMFNTQSGWSGNLNELSPYSGYWINIDSSNDWEINFDRGDIEDCEPYEFSFGNNLFSYKWGTGYALTMDALGGEEFATENYNFILGQGVGLFNTSEGWAGNLNYLKEGKGYWINFKYSNNDYEFKWGFDNCNTPPDIQSLNKIENEIPQEFQFNQSTEQAFYLIDNLTNSNLEIGDIVLAYNNNILVGSANFNEQITVLPIMGKDLSETTAGYCEIGDRPILKYFDLSSGSILDLEHRTIAFENLNIENISVVNSEINNPKPNQFTFNSPFPNPFNPETTINYYIENDGAIGINIFNLQGEFITNLFKGKKSPGYHSMVWNASHFSSGTYFIEISYEQNNSIVTEIRKVILVK